MFCKIGKRGFYNRVVTTDGSWSRGEGVGCTKHGWKKGRLELRVEKWGTGRGVVLRPVLTTSLPCQTIATTGPEFMSRRVNYAKYDSIHLTSLQLV